MRVISTQDLHLGPNLNGEQFSSELSANLALGLLPASPSSRKSVLGTRLCPRCRAVEVENGCYLHFFLTRVWKMFSSSSGPSERCIPEFTHRRLDLGSGAHHKRRALMQTLFSTNPGDVKHERGRTAFACYRGHLASVPMSASRTFKMSFCKSRRRLRKRPLGTSGSLYRKYCESWKPKLPIRAWSACRPGIHQPRSGNRGSPGG